jgi:hypothetical protein
MDPRGSHLRKIHPANPSLPEESVHPTTVLAQLAAGKLFEGLITERDHSSLGVIRGNQLNSGDFSIRPTP